ncbi:hypothetical protein CWB99_16270 [Pseudoalteromonas rubra]|uniref:HTH araC/xylS-type domain-containing protein n=2 Tax=Pseudoalteromonas rubra TaxID=43658 RepID=A0A5S3WIJ4_9GAMM|nr:hypothetical protein CWB99_16270 [Pseudoalteromonas rubra]TMP36169.1 hypothetical protein CWC00_02835 [Pseudoalteromonas rubra]
MVEKMMPADLSKALHDQGIEHHLCAGASSELAEGTLRFSQFDQNLRIHCSAMTELENTTNTAALQPCIAFTVLFHGALTFSVGECRYEVSTEDSPLVFVNVVAEPQIFTRFMQRNQRVEKITVTLTYQWLKNKLQANHSEVYTNHELLSSSHVSVLSIDESNIELARQIFDWDQNKIDPFAKINQERCVLALVPTLLDTLTSGQCELVQQLVPRDYPLESEKDTNQKLHQLLKEDLSLEQIATQLGMSVSTLQRYFKSQFQTTVKQYIKLQRLQAAKKSIMLGQATIGEAAYHAGYNHVGNFISAFKKAFGVTPKQLLKNHRT